MRNSNKTADPYRASLWNARDTLKGTIQRVNLNKRTDSPEPRSKGSVGLKVGRVLFSGIVYSILLLVISALVLLYLF